MARGRATLTVKLFHGSGYPSTQRTELPARPPCGSWPPDAAAVRPVVDRRADVEPRMG